MAEAEQGPGTVADEAGARLTEIGQIAVNVQDVHRAEAFYRDQMGLEHLFSFPGLTFFRCGGVRLMLSHAEQSEHDHPSSILYFRVGDIAAAHRRMAERGVAFEGAPHVVHKDARHELWLAAFRDSEGNTLALMSEVPLA